jgi:formate C-acetyltransferase
MYSATIKTSLEQGRDGYAYAAKYNNSAMPCCGLGSTVDSLMAVKTFVFEERELTLQQMSDILEADWDGYEVLRHKIQNDPRKYGNHNPEADAMAACVADFFSKTCCSIPNERGGHYKAALHVARAYIHHGKKTGATPDGRKAGEEFSKNADPAAGRDKQGATAQILSALSLTPPTFPEAFCVDVMLHPSAVSGNDGLMLLKGLLMTYLGGGGMSLQFNVFDADTLKDAQRHPEKYPNLQIRVCGWNVLWNNMCKAEQDVFIKRAEGLQ